MPKTILTITVLGLLLFSCRKDPELTEEQQQGSSCAEYEQTTNSYDQLIIDSLITAELYNKSIPQAGPHFDLAIDIDCDGVGDFQFEGEGDADWIGSSTITQSSLRFKSLNPNLYVYTYQNQDTTYQYNLEDTVGMVIYYDSQTTSYYQPGATFQSENTATYVKGFVEGDTLIASDPGWNNGTVTLRSNYKNGSDWQYGPDGNGYSQDILDLDEFNRGSISSNEYIGLKYDGPNGVKLGYIDWAGYVTGSFVDFNFSFIRMHR